MVVCFAVFCRSPIQFPIDFGLITASAGMLVFSWISFCMQLNYILDATTLAATAIIH